jgi:hypothetical protein
LISGAAFWMILAKGYKRKEEYRMKKKKKKRRI